MSASGHSRVRVLLAGMLVLVFGLAQTPVALADAGSPTVAITAPSNNASVAKPVTISGTAGDDVAVVAVEVAVFRGLNGGQYWTGSVWQSAYIREPAVLATPNTPSSTWSYVFNPPEAAGQYYAQAVVFDNASGYTFTGNTAFLVPDGADPAVTIVAPVNNASVARPTTISGTATDDVAVAGVEVAIYNGQNAQWWSGTAWQVGYTRVATVLGSPNATSTTWSYTFTSTEAAGVYAVHALVFDSSYRYVFSPYVVFVNPDTVNPSGSITTPPDGATVALPVSITGTAADDVGVGRVDLAIYLNGQWWNGSSFQASYTRVVAVLASPGATSTGWSYNFGPPSGGTFAVSATILDMWGNYVYTPYQYFVSSATPSNTPPVNTVPGAQSTPVNSNLVFSVANSNAISTSDADAAASPVKITLGVTNGTLTLSGVAGLSFTTGDGIADALMVFTGTLSSVNAALNGLAYAPTAAFVGAATLTLTTDDQGATGSGGPQTDTDSVTITVDAAPSVIGTTPTGGGFAGVNSNVTVTFSEPVAVTGNWFQIVCASSGTRNPADTVVTGGPNTFTINPTIDFTSAEACTVTVFAAQVADQDSNDPPDHMAANHVFAFTIDVAPTVTATIPVNGANPVATNTNVTVTFSEPVTVTGNWFQIVCATSGTRNPADTAVTGGPTVFTIDATVDFIPAELCTVTVFAAQVTDQDTNDPPDNMPANHVFSFTTDAAPAVVSTSPVNSATGVAASTNIVINFSEPVTVTLSTFTIECPTPGNTQAYALSGSGTNQATLNPTVNLPGGTVCTVTVIANQVSDTDAVDPPDALAANYVFAFSVPPVANADTYAATGNIAIQVTAPGVMSNDAGPAAVVSKVNGSAVNVGNPTTGGSTNGTVTLNSNGSFTYDPPVGVFIGTDTFTYTITNAAGESNTATVSVNLSAGMWFICDACASTNKGTLLNPYTSVGAFSANNTGASPTPQAAHKIYVESGTYNGATDTLALLNTQTVIGQGESAATALGSTPTNVHPAFVALTTGTRPSIAPTAGNGVTLASSNTLRNFDVGNVAATVVSKISGTNVGNLTITNMTLTGTGQAININGGSTLNVTFDSVSSTSGANNIKLISIAGALTANGGALSGATNEAVSIATSTATINYAGTVGSTTKGISLTGNTGGTVNFTGALTLNTATFPAFTATGGGTITATAAATTLTTATGTALNIANTNIGAAGLLFQAISSNGAVNGIVLNATGTAGRLAVTGTGTAGTGGTIQNSTTDGILLTSTASPTLSFMNINDSAGTATDDGVVLTNVTGIVAFTGVTISGAPHNGMTLDNFNTNLTSFTMTNSTITCPVGFSCQPSGSTGNDGLLLQMRGNSVLTSGLVTGSTFNNLRAVAVQVQTNDSGRIGNASGGAIVAPALSNSFTVTASHFTGNGQGIDMDNSQVSSMAFQILANTEMTGSASHAINVFTAAGADTGPASHFHVGRIDGNVIGTQGAKDSGSRFGSGIRAVIQGQNTQGSMTISNNIIREVVNATGIFIVGQNGGNNTPGTNTAKFKIVGNTMPTPSGSTQSLCGIANTACADTGIFVLADELTPVCTVITGNNIYDVSTMNGSFDIYLAERIGPPAGAQLTVEGTGGSNSGYILANNTLAGPNKFVDEGANTSQVGLGTCGNFPS